MPKTLNGKKVPERYWKEAKKQARKQGFTIKDDKDKFYQYAMGIVKKMMNESVVAGDVAVPNCPITGKPKKLKRLKKQKWVELLLKDK